MQNEETNANFQLLDRKKKTRAEMPPRSLHTQNLSKQEKLFTCGVWQSTKEDHPPIHTTFFEKGIGCFNVLTTGKFRFFRRNVY